MRIAKFNWLRCCVTGTVLGVTAGALAQQSRPTPNAADAPKGQPSASPAKEATNGSVKPVAGAVPGTTKVSRRDSFDLTVAHEENFKKFLPKSFAKLTNRERFHVVSIGDSAMDVAPKKGAKEEEEKSFPVVFATELATQFYYTGGVRVIRPAVAVKPGEKAAIPHLGPEITLRNIAREGGLMIHAMQLLTTYGFEHEPDLVVVGFGIQDAAYGLNPASYASALREVITTVRSRGAELVLLGPTLAADEPAEESLGRTRPYLDIMREIAADTGVLFVDLGDLASLVTVGGSVTEPAVVFDQIVRQYKRFFTQSDAADFTHPSAELHAILGKRIFAQLTRGPVVSAWAVSGGSATMEAADKFTLQYDLKNPSDKEVVYSVLPLVVRDWKPMDAAPQVTLKAGESKPMQVAYARRPGVGGGLPSHEPMLRLPVLISGAGMTRIEDVRAELKPFTLLWKLDTLFNQDKSFKLENLLCNTTAAPLKGTWAAEWLGQKKSGSFEVAAGEKQELPLVFDLPSTASAWRQTGPVVMEVTAGALKLRFDRNIEISRNIGLKQTVALTPRASAAGSAGVSLKFEADANALYLIYEISGFNLEDAGADKSAFEYELRIDARSYGKRMGLGAVDALLLSGRAADGVYPFETPPPWVFGTGYAASYDPNFIRGLVGSTGSGSRRFTVTLPRSYLYLHEWAMGNGNSQIGIRTDLAFWKGPRDGAQEGGFPDDLNFSLVSSSRHPDDAEGLAVLELTDKPTARWTVNPF